MMTENSASPESIIRDYPRLTLEDSFSFQCHQSLECFTRCCNDVTIVLTPYDVIRMKQALHMDSSEFLEKYTLSPFSKDQKIPVVILKMDPETKDCSFVSKRKRLQHIRQSSMGLPHVPPWHGRTGQSHSFGSKLLFPVA
jgi:hypothetical protein